MNLEDFKLKAKNNAKHHQFFLNQLKRQKPKKLDEWFQTEHDAVFSEIDCLQCANCCKTTSPIFYQKDIERAAKHLRIKPGQFIETYLHMDKDGDFVLNQAPCPFLGYDNYCTIYDSRPTACREYPHTNRKKIVQLMDLTYKNTQVCPAVFQIVENIRKKQSIT
jgi:uncharacterized protein